MLSFSLGSKISLKGPDIGYRTKDPISIYMSLTKKQKNLCYLYKLSLCFQLFHFSNYFIKTLSFVSQWLQNKCIYIPYIEYSHF